MSPYTTPPSLLLTKPQNIIYTVIRTWAAIFGSLVATVPVGLAIDLILFDLDLMRFNDHTAVYWGVSSILASLICSSAIAWLTTPRLTWYQFWVTYQLGWLAYSLSGGIGQSYNQITGILYLWIPFIVPALVAIVAPLFNSIPRNTIDFGSE